MALKIIAAVAQNGVIGKAGTLPWRLRADLQFFKEMTLNHPVVMGHNTFEEILERLGKPLPGRENIILSGTPGRIRIGGVTAIDNFTKVIDMSKSRDLFVIGGASLYKLALPFAQEMYITQVLAEVEGDTFFPDWDPRDWWLYHSSPVHPKDEKNDHEFVFQIYKRVKPASS